MGSYFFVKLVVPCHLLRHLRNKGFDENSEGVDSKLKINVRMNLYKFLFKFLFDYVEETERYSFP